MVKLEAKLLSAKARKAEKLYEKIEAAAALGTERVLGAAINRLKANAADDSARCDLRSALDLAALETSRRKAAVLEEIVHRASRSGGSERVAYVVERLQNEKKHRELALSAKLEDAAKRKKEQLLEKTTPAVADKVAKAKEAREGRRLALQNELDAKTDRAAQRRELETLERVVKAARRGEAVAYAAAKRDILAAEDRATKENRLEAKLAQGAQRREINVQRLVAKANKQTEKVADAAKTRANTPPRPQHSLQDAADRRSKTFDDKVNVAAHLGSRRVETVRARKARLNEQAHNALKESLDLKQHAAAERHAQQLQALRRGLNGKRNFRTVGTQHDAPEATNDGATSYFSAACAAVFGACVGRFK